MTRNVENNIVRKRKFIRFLLWPGLKRDQQNIYCTGGDYGPGRAHDFREETLVMIAADDQINILLFADVENMFA